MKFIFKFVFKFIFKFTWQIAFLLLMTQASAQSAQTFFDLQATSIDGTTRKLSSYRGKVVLVANTASGCGYTPQYKDLEALSKKYSSRGLVVLGFPSNDFGGQEPGSNHEIKQFCELNYKVDFPLFSKAPVTGSDAQPVFTWLVSHSPADVAGPVEWNFEKFLISRDGRLVKRYRSKTNPTSPDVTTAIEEELSQTMN